MEYKYEIHCHTKNVSRCGNLDVEELIQKYKDAGYSGIVLTDHYSPMTFDLPDFFNKKTIPTTENREYSTFFSDFLPFHSQIDLKSHFFSYSEQS